MFTFYYIIFSALTLFYVAWSTPDIIIYEIEKGAVKVISAEVSAYNAEVSQTDSSPFITASNKKVRPGIVANNCLKFGSKVMINDSLFVVEDRMNRRYGCEHFDIFMWSKKEALEFGRKILEVRVVYAEENE